MDLRVVVVRKRRVKKAVAQLIEDLSSLIKHVSSAALPLMNLQLSGCWG